MSYPIRHNAHVVKWCTVKINDLEGVFGWLATKPEYGGPQNKSPEQVLVQIEKIQMLLEGMYVLHHNETNW